MTSKEHHSFEDLSLAEAIGTCRSISSEVVQEVSVLLSDGGVGHHPQGVLPD